MVEHPDPALTTLTSSECYELLGSRQFGRLGVIAERYPLIIPVNYALEDNVVVIRSRPGTKLANAEHANVTFQVDHIDEQTHSGWSVLVRAQAETVTPEHSREITERTAATGLQPWAPGEDFHWVRLIPHGISGRRLVAGQIREWELGTAAYM